MQVLVKAFEAEKMLARVSSCQGCGRDVGRAAPEVDGQFAVNPDGDRGTDVVTLEEVVFKGVADALEAGSAGAVDGVAGVVAQRAS